MLFWTLIALLTAAAILAVLLPLARGRDAAEPPEAARHDRAVYRDQLAELERERAEGRIGREEADAAYAEIARRLITSHSGSPDAPRGDALARRRAAAVLALVGVPALTLSFYLAQGAPSLPGQPLATRLATPPAARDMTMLIAQVEEHLSRNPQDGRGWEVLAPVYMRMGRPVEAARAYGNAVRILGSTAAREADLGESLVAAGDGIVTAEARAAFERALADDPRAPKARFFLGLARQQEGDVAAAADTWRALLADAPPDAPWRASVQAALARIGAGEGEGEAPAPSGPSEADMAAAAQMSPEARQAMVEDMVAGLAERLRDQPEDPEGWLRLVRAYAVMGRRADASAAAGEAIGRLGREADRLRVRDLATDLGLAPGGANP